MSRPSYWILISLGFATTVVVATGAWRRAFSAPRVDHWVQQRGHHAWRTVARGGAVELFGVVVDRRGAVVAGAEVAVVGGDERALSDADGRFTLEVLGRRSRELAVTHGGRSLATPLDALPGEPFVAVLGDTPPWGSQSAAASTTGSPLAGEGFLVDDHGDPVPFGIVSVRETGDTVVADDRGRFQVPLPSDAPVVLVARDEHGRAAMTKPFHPSRRTGLVPVADLELKERCALGGQVRNHDGFPSGGAIVVVRDGAIQRAAVTDRDGHFAIVGLCEGVEYAVTALPHLGQAGRRRTVRVEGRTEIDLMLEPVEDRRWQVVDEAGSPCALAHVFANDGIAPVYDQADAEGYVDLEDLAATAAVAFEVRGEDLGEFDIVAIGERTITVK